MPAPRKRKAPASKKSTPTPAKKAPAKKKQPTGTFRERLANLVGAANIPGAESVLVEDGNIESLWSTPRTYISTRAIAIDKLIGHPGLPTGRFVEVYGPEGSGKSTLVDQLVAETQARGGVAVVVDTEHVRDKAYMAALGVRVDEIVWVQATTIESVFAAIRYYCQTIRQEFGDDVPILFVWDSVADTPTMAEFKAEPGQKFQAEAAKVIKQEFRTTTQVVAESQALVVCVNQVYKKIGNFFGPDDETYGGGGIKYLSSVRLALMVVGTVKPRGATKEDKVAPVGQIVFVKTTKNKVGPPLKWRKMMIYFGHGVDNGWSLFEELQAPGIIQQNGSWYRLSPEYGDFPPWQGGHWGLNELIAGNPDLYKRLLKAYEELPA